MHELSIAMSIIDLVEEEMGRRGGRGVAVVHLRVGQLAGVVPDALQFSYALAAEQTPLAGSALVIEEVPVRAFCPDCDEGRPIRSLQDFRCRECGSQVVDVLEGRELLVTSLELQS